MLERLRWEDDPFDASLVPQKDPYLRNIKKEWASTAQSRHQAAFLVAAALSRPGKEGLGHP